jgi:hypothetical protein
MILAGMFSGAGERLHGWFYAATWTCTVAALGSVLPAASCTPDCYYGAMAWLLALTVAGADWGRGCVKTRPRWRGLAMTWGLIGCLLWLAGAYWQDEALGF